MSATLLPLLAADLAAADPPGRWSVRQILDEGSGRWATVHRQRRTTKNTSLEGSSAVIHWTQWFFPFADEGGARSRHSVLFEWRRDRPGRDRVALRRELAFRPCVVAPS